MRTVIGRERELAAVEGLLDNANHEFSALLLVGEAGIGKTTVLQEAVRLGEESGNRVLRSRPAQAEATLGFSALSDLLSSVEEDVLADLPDPQRHAVEAALLRVTPRAGGSASRAVAAGLLSVLRRLAETSPVLIAIDDVQWLDRASEAALAFALRRLAPDSTLALLVAQRRVGRATNPLGFADLPARWSTRVVLDPLNLSALYHVINDQLGIVVARPTLQRIEEASGGNPLLAVELARALADAGERLGPGEPLPVPGEISTLLAERLARLPLDTQESLLAAALLADPRVGIIAEAVGSSAGESMERAVDAELVELRGDRIRFAHPLVGDVVASSVSPTRRREMHRRLAEVAPSGEERARHLALGSEGPDANVAAGLEDVAGLADRRGAPEDAAELLELAWKLTPQDDAAGAARRRVELARALGRAGDDRAADVLDDLLRAEPGGLLRARALELRAHIHWVAGTTREAEACCEEALAYVEGDDLLRARILVTLARITLDAELLRQRSAAAVELLESLDEPDPGLLSEALICVAGANYALGNGVPADVVERALELERVAPTPIVADRTSAALGTWLKYEGDFTGARHWLEATRQAALDEGDEGSLPYALSHLPQIELWTGDWARAEALALEHLELAETTGQENERMTAIYNVTLVHAHMGRVDEARSRIDRALPGAERGEPWSEYQLVSVRGFVELSLGQAAEAVTSLGRAFEIYEDTGSGGTPAVFENYPEALLAVGDVETATQVIDVFEQRSRKAGKAIGLAPALRCRGQLLAVEGTLDEALASVDAALAQHELVDLPFSLARTLVVRGQILRRRGERRAARDDLERAQAIFEELGSPLWAERARAELARVPSRRPSGDELSATETQVAELVAQGMTNGEVAQALFVTKKTVEANLTRVYRKLGVRSRVALAARMSERDTGEDPAIP